MSKSKTKQKRNHLSKWRISQLFQKTNPRLCRSLCPKTKFRLACESTFSSDDILEIKTKLNDGIITVSTRSLYLQHFNKFHHTTIDKCIQMSCLSQNTETMPSARTWIGNVKVIAQTYHNGFYCKSHAVRVRKRHYYKFS